ncbi:putative Glucan endo-1 3-beta-glucosidase precursor [Tripterygium wilfordii]|uniref:glucan endo-1,3-beta-D-glucosidase n=1 Tax=Tripterygium wilfordii TaxID=458696 RepID=A0A7J7D341_TRIWF|nr:glucan endo-1,3-beta-D-glucosidase-like [Tripterygium wilfordii]KAF5740765.1 putative Glucan endo-1 3-beta-glucosidase precursor [Tripterygium wilfordii]
MESDCGPWVLLGCRNPVWRALPLYQTRQIIFTFPIMPFSPLFITIFVSRAPNEMLQDRDNSISMAALSYSAAFLLLAFLQALSIADSQSFIGVNYGQVADNLPTPAASAKLLQSTYIRKVRLYGSDPEIIKSLANTGIGIFIGTTNGDIPALASDPNFAKNWVNTNVAQFYPSSNIILISVGNEVMTFGDRNLITQLVPAMRNIQNALNGASLGGKIKVTTVHTMALLNVSEPPSAGTFDQINADVLKGILEFNNATGSPFAINPYPYFAYRGDPNRRDTLAFCLFKPNSGRVDARTKIKYLNMFDAQLDAVRSALNGWGFKNVDVVVAETGWPYKGDPNEVGATVENARTYIGNLVHHLRTKIGTPLMPNKSMDTYIFALYDENLKPGPGSERAFGLFKPDQSINYNVGLSRVTPKVPVAPSPNPIKGAWCLPKQGLSDAELQSNLDYACGLGIDCSPIKPGGACFEPNTVFSHAAYAMNLLYQSSGRNPWNCDFSHTAILSSNNPSYKGCSYPGEST